jgi:hypothetical protein
MSPIRIIKDNRGNWGVFWDKIKFDRPKTAIELAWKIDHTFMPLRLVVNLDQILEISPELYFTDPQQFYTHILTSYDIYGILMRNEQCAKELEDELLKVYEWSILKS